MRRALAPLLAALACAGCASAGGATTGRTGGSTASASQAAGAAITTDDGRVYTIASAGSTLRLDDVAARIVSLSFTRHAPVRVAPAGTTVYARAKLRLRNASRRRQVVRPTQIWMLDGLGHTFLAADAHVPDPLLGRGLQPGEIAVGTVIFPLPARRSAANLLVYRFADGRAIAQARHMGLMRLPAR